jgi:hypothetical protein
MFMTDTVARLDPQDPSSSEVARQVRRWRGERGITLPVVAITMLTLLVFSAFAIDVGLTYNYRRQDQSSVDAAAISAAMEYLNNTGTANAPDLVFEEVVRLTHENSMTGMTIEAWRDAWLACQDPGTGAGTEYPLPLTIGAGTVDCVSFDATATRMRIRLPEHDVPGVFAGVVGTQFSSSAVAEVEVTPTAGFGNVLPFALPSITADGYYSCLYAATGYNNAACHQNAAGSWGAIGSPRPTHPLGNGCNVGPSGMGTWVAHNLAMGGDHELALYDDAHGERLDRCPADGGVVPSQAANTLHLTVGFTGQILENGLFAHVFPDGERGRLTRNIMEPLGTPASGSWHGVNRSELDNTPIWRFIPDHTMGQPNGKPVGQDLDLHIPLTCHPRLYTAFVDRDHLDDTLTVLGLTEPDRVAVIAGIEATFGSYPVNLARKPLMDLCFRNFNNGEWLPADVGAPGYTNQGTSYRSDLFDRRFEDDPDEDYWMLRATRFAWVPEALEYPGNFDACNGGTNCWWKIGRFRPVYMNTVHSGTGANQGPWHAGEQPTAGNDNSIRGINVYTFNLEMIPQEILDAGPVDPAGSRRVNLIR